MEIIFLAILVSAIVSVKKYRSAGFLPFIPMVAAIIFIIALYINILNSIDYVDSHPWLSGNQAGWFKGYWPIPFLARWLLLLGRRSILVLTSQRRQSHKILRARIVYS